VSSPEIDPEALDWLRTELDRPDLAFRARLTAIPGGNQTEIRRFDLAGAPEELSAPPTPRTRSPHSTH